MAKSAYSLILILLACWLPASASGVLARWHDHIVTSDDWNAFGWGESDRLEQAWKTWHGMSEPSTEELRRILLTVYTFDALGSKAPPADRELVDRLHSRYLIWRWLDNTVSARMPSSEWFAEECGKRLDQFDNVAMFRFRRVFIPVESEDAQGRIEARSRLEAIRDKLMQGRSFESVVHEAGLPDNMLRILGPFESGRIDPQLEKPLLSMKPGEYSLLIETGKGFHLVQLVERYMSHDAAAPVILRDLKASESRNLAREVLEDLLVRSGVESSPPQPDDESGVLIEFFSMALGRDVSAAEAGSLRMAILRETDGVDGNSERVLKWIRIRQTADAAFEKEVNTRLRMALHEEDRLRQFYLDHPGWFRDKDKLLADALIVDASAPDSASPHERYTAHEQALQLAEELLEFWRSGKAPEEFPGGLPPCVVLQPASVYLTLPQAGFQVSEAVRGLVPGEVGGPIYSKSRNTFLIARLEDRIEGDPKPFCPDDPELIRLFTSELRRQLKDELQTRMACIDEPVYTVSASQARIPLISP